MSYRKKLIEVALPLDEINAESAREKSIRHGHPSTLHLWWARRPLAACRAVLFASLVDDPSNDLPEDEAQVERERLFDIIRDLVKWENSSDEAVLGRARREILRSTGGEPPPVLDPFCGGGSIPLEAQRLGLEAHGSDLNPVAVMITKALIELPPKFAGEPPVNPESRKTADLSSWRGAQGLAEDVRHYGAWMREKAKERIGHLYPTGPEGETVIAWLWARTVRCPNPACGATMPLVSSFWLSKKPNKKAWVEPVVVSGGDTPDGRPGVRFVVKDGQKSGAPPDPPKLGRGAKFRCLVCDQISDDSHIKAEGKAGRMGQQLMAVVAEGHRGRKYLEATEAHVVAAEQARPEWGPEQELPDNTRWFSPPVFGMDTYDKLFTPRQLVALGTFSDLVGEARDLARSDALAALGARASSSHREPQGWHSRGYLPHFDGGEIPQAITFRLAGTLPKEVIDDWDESGLEELERRRLIEDRLDEGEGNKWLADPRIAPLVENALLHFDGDRYDLHGWVIMPNHVHVLITPRRGKRLSDILHSWKSYTSKEANRILGRTGSFWQEEYFDRFIRDGHHFATAMEYIENNPVKAGLCGNPEEWRYSSASRREDHARAARMAAPPDGLGARASHSHEDEERAAAYADAVATYLAFAVDKLSTTNCSICQWQTQPTRLVAAFGRQAIPMVWDFAEANTFGRVAGDYALGIDSLTRVLDNWFRFGAEGSVRQQDATTFETEMLPLISSDPPYYDNIGYADLADYFYVWMRRSLGGVYPEIFGTMLVPKAAELVATPSRFGGSRQKAQQFFENGLGMTFRRMRERANPDYPVTIYYAFKQAESEKPSANGGVAGDGHGVLAVASTGWETMLTGLMEAGFQITGTWPVRTELTVALKAKSNALASSVVMVCRPRPENAPVASRRDFQNALRRELPGALSVMMRENIAPVDLAQATIGPGMAIYSRYSSVLENDGTPLNVRTALQLINQQLDAVLAEQDGDLDGESRFCVAWYEQFGTGEGDYGLAETLSKAKNTSVRGLAESGVLAQRAGKVRLLKREELPDGWDPATDGHTNTWEMAQHLVKAVLASEKNAAAIVRKLGPDRAEEARQLAYRLYQICDRKKRPEEAFAYNALSQSWERVLELSRREEEGALF